MEAPCLTSPGDRPAENRHRQNILDNHVQFCFSNKRPSWPPSHPAPWFGTSSGQGSWGPGRVHQCQKVPEDGAISKCKPGGALERALSLGHLGQTGSLGCGRGRSLRLLGLCRARLCSLSLFLVRSHALFQPEHLAHSPCGESKWATPVGGESTK